MIYDIIIENNFFIDYSHYYFQNIFNDYDRDLGILVSISISHLFISLNYEKGYNFFFFKYLILSCHIFILCGKQLSKKYFFHYNLFTFIKITNYHLKWEERFPLLGVHLFLSPIYRYQIPISDNFHLVTLIT